MANIELLENVVHQGIVLKQGMIVSDGAQHPSDAAQNLTGVVNNLVDRGLAKVTNSDITHTTSLVNGGQEPLPVSATNGGKAPNAANDAQRKATAKAKQEEADKTVANTVAEQSQEESQPIQKGSLLSRAKEALASAPATEVPPAPTAPTDPPATPPAPLSPEEQAVADAANATE